MSRVVERSFVFASCRRQPSWGVGALGTLAALLGSGFASAQGGFNWIQSPVNGHLYARIAPSSHGSAIATANGQLASLATIRNQAEQTWLVSSMLNGQDAWINMSCDRTWLNGWPDDFVAPGSDGPNCATRYHVTYNSGSVACNPYNPAICEGITDGYTQPCSNLTARNFYCNSASFRFFASANGSWYSRHGAGNRYAIIEQVTNDPYSWGPLNSPTAPSPRHAAASTYDSIRDRTVYFGGFDGALRNDTWEWTPQNGWAFRISFTAPSVRQLSAMAFDSTRNQTVLFGGRNTTTALGDTWLWNGNNWTQVTTPTAPSARQSHAMAFDSQRGRLVLFGGTTDTTVAGNSETWEFDGAAWTQVTTTNAPSGRWGHAMFYDLASRKVVLFGGRTSTGASNETWTYDGTNWTQQILTVSPPARYEMAFAYDNSRPRGVIVGGWDGSTNSDDVWAYLGFNWYKLHIATRPGARRQAAMTYHKDRLYLVGGFTNTIVWDPWIGSAAPGIRAFGTGCGSPALAVAGAAGYTPRIGSPLRLDVTGVPASAPTFMTVGGSKTSVGSFLLPLPLDGLGMPGCWLYNDAAFHLALSCTATGTSTSQFDLAIPAQPFLVGFHLYFQAWAAHPPANSSGILTSNGLDVTVGGF